MDLQSPIESDQGGEVHLMNEDVCIRRPLDLPIPAKERNTRAHREFERTECLNVISLLSLSWHSLGLPPPALHITIY